MRRFLALLAGLALVSPASAAPSSVPSSGTSDWWLLDVAQGADSAFVIDKHSLIDNGNRKQATVAVIYDVNSEIAAIEMTLVVDCATRREKARSVRLHDQSGRVFPQGVSGRFEVAETGQPWHQYLCSGADGGQALAPLGAAFPTVAARRLLDDPALRATLKLGRPG